MTELLNHYGGLWLRYFGPAVIQNTVFLGVLFVVLFLLRRQSASLRYLVALVGLVKLLLPPFLKLPVLLPSYEQIRHLPVVISGIPFIRQPVVPGQVAPGPVASQPATLDTTGLVFTLWCLCMALFVFLSIASTVRLARVVRNAEEVDDAVGTLTRRRYGIRIFRTERIAMPMTIGIFPHRIFVPSCWDRWSLECRKLVMQHELAHIKRHDGIVQFVQIVAQAIYLFHPLVWLLNRLLKRLREMACDDATVRVEVRSGIAYSRYLVEIAETMAQHHVSVEPASALMWHKNELLDRVKYQMTGGGVRLMSANKTAIVLAGLVLLTLPFSWYYGEARPGVEVDSILEAGAPVTDSLSPAPPAPPAPPKPAESGKKKEVMISLSRGRKARVEGEEIAFKELRRVLEEHAEGDPEHTVIGLVCAPGVTMREMYDLQYIMRELDLVKVRYLAKDGEGVPLVLPPFDVKERLEEMDPDDIAVVMVNNNGMIGPEGEPRKPEELERILRRRIADNPRLVVIIRTVPETEYESFLRVLRHVKAAGAMRVVVDAPGDL
jgi:beta-lactamase regulating signal transducer with metallopeptidase domain/biopolymer transport protein ExbD